MTDRLASASRAAAVTVALAALLIGCGSDPASPAEQRRVRVTERLEASFSRQQARCIVGDLDATTLRALDLDAKLPTDGKALADYSDALSRCVIAQDGP